MISNDKTKLGWFQTEPAQQMSAEGEKDEQICWKAAAKPQGDQVKCRKQWMCVYMYI